MRQAGQLNISRQAVIKTLLRQALDQQRFGERGRGSPASNHLRKRDSTDQFNLSATLENGAFRCKRLKCFW